MIKGNLKACPFCQKRVGHVIEEDANNFAVCCDVYKGGCGATAGYASTIEKAVENWNMRGESAKNFYLDTERGVFLTRDYLLAEFQSGECETETKSFEGYLANATSSQGFLETLDKAVRMAKYFDVDFVTIADCITRSDLTIQEKTELYSFVGNLYIGGETSD